MTVIITIIIITIERYHQHPTNPNPFQSVWVFAAAGSHADRVGGKWPCRHFWSPPPPPLPPNPPFNPTSPVFPPSPFLYLLTKPITLFLYYLCPRLISTTSYSGLENELFMIYCCKKLEGPAICFFSHSVPSRSVKTFLNVGKLKQSHHNHNIFPNFDLLYVMMSPYDI